MQKEKEHVKETSKPRNDMKNSACSTGRADFYPFNQTFLDDYYRTWQERRSNN